MMEVGDKIVLRDDIDIGSYKRHGEIIRVNSDSAAFYSFEILFADGVLENYAAYQCRAISDKEYFLLHLS